MKPIYRLAFVCVVMICCVTLDQLTKSIASDRLAAAPTASYLGGLFVLTYSENPGAILGLGGSLPKEVRILSFALVVCAAVVATLVLAVRDGRVGGLQLTALALVSGGGIGNLIDRLANSGWVVDFMVLRAGPLSTGIFNIADVAIFSGMGLLILSAFLTNKRGVKMAHGGQ